MQPAARACQFEFVQLQRARQLETPTLEAIIFLRGAWETKVDNPQVAAENKRASTRLI